MFCKPEVKLILESLWAERENGRAEIRQGAMVRKTAGTKRGVSLVQSNCANSAARHECAY